MNFSRLGTAIGLLLSLGLPLTWIPPLLAQNEPPLEQTLENIAAAATSQDLEQLRSFYSPEFSTSEGIGSQELLEKLSLLWEQYADLTYDIELISSETDGEEIVAETLTTLRGTRQVAGREIAMESQLRSRQRLVDGQLVSQTILSEQTQLTSGDNPPTVMVNLPDMVQTGQRFNFDVVIEEPLEDDILLGAVVEQEVTDYADFSTRPLEFEVLPAGGIFRVGTASSTPEDTFLSAAILRDGGMVIVTRRLRVVSDPSASL